MGSTAPDDDAFFTFPPTSRHYHPPRDFADAVPYALSPPRDKPLTAAMYGGLPRGVPEIDQMVRGVMTGMLDSFQDVPAEVGD